MTRILFLDIDGVLNSKRWEDSPGVRQLIDGPMLDPQACLALSKALEKISNVKIVLITSWVDSMDLNEFKEVFKPFGLDNKFLMAKIEEAPNTKQEGITEFLRMLSSDIKFVILDDEIIFDLGHPFYPSQVKTSLTAGMLPRHIDEIVFKLS
jgi:hypothetical protein